MFKAVYALGNTNNAVFFPDAVIEANETPNNPSYSGMPVPSDPTTPYPADFDVGQTLCERPGPC
jgi:hypothetical protein